MFSQLLILNMYGEILITFGIFLFILMVSRVVRNVNEMRVKEERIFSGAMRIGSINEMVLSS